MTVITPGRKPRFKKITDKGFETLRAASEYPMALKTWALVAQHADHTNVLVATNAALAGELGCSARTVRRALLWLEQKGFVVLIRVGTARAIVLDPDAIWGSLDQYKNVCIFHGKVMAKPDATLRKRLTHMLRVQGRLPPEDEPPAS